MEEYIVITKDGVDYKYKLVKENNILDLIRRYIEENFNYNSLYISKKLNITSQILYEVRAIDRFRPIEKDTRRKPTYRASALLKSIRGALEH